MECCCEQEVMRLGWLCVLANLLVLLPWYLYAAQLLLWQWQRMPCRWWPSCLWMATTPCVCYQVGFLCLQVQGYGYVYLSCLVILLWLPSVLIDSMWAFSTNFILCFFYSKRKTVEEIKIWLEILLSSCNLLFLILCDFQHFNKCCKNTYVSIH